MIIGLTGKARAGKDTAAQIIRRLLPKTKVVVLSFSEPLYDMVRASEIFDSVDELAGDMKSEPTGDFHVSLRYVLQTLGTEWGRNLIHPDLWCKLGLRQCVDPQTVYVFTDVRFLNEEKAIRNRGGLIWKIDDLRYEHKTRWDRVAEFFGVAHWQRHQSETEMEQIEADAVIVNRKLGSDIYASNIRSVLKSQRFLDNTFIDNRPVPAGEFLHD